MSAAMTDIELIGYCEIHCTTERALFSAEHVNHMIELAGNPPGFKRQNGWVSAHAEMQELCDLARARIVPPVPSIATLVAAGSVDTAEFQRLAELWRYAPAGTREFMAAWDGQIAHIDAWGAQQREAGKQDAIGEMMDINRRFLRRSEKAEADLKQVNEWRAAALTESQTLGELWASKVEQAEARVKELQAELDIELERAYDCLLAARTNKQADRQALQAEGKHPAPCARDCEAPAFKNQVRERDARIAQLEARLVRRRAPLSPEAQQAIAAARAAGQTIAATPGGLAFLNSGAEPGSGELDCPACGGSGHAGDVPAGSTP